MVFVGGSVGAHAVNDEQNPNGVSKTVNQNSVADWILWQQCFDCQQTSTKPFLLEHCAFIGPRPDNCIATKLGHANSGPTDLPETHDANTGLLEFPYQ